MPPIADLVLFALALLAALSCQHQRLSEFFALHG
jgi:hypothetical protein